VNRPGTADGDRRYDVALSFAGEDRGPALALATRLRGAGFRVFFDRFEELWGQDLSERLHEVYDHQCRHAVVFVSGHYLRRPWTNYERRVLVARAMREDAGFLLPIRVDDTELPGLPGVMAYKSLHEEGLDAIFDALCRLLAGGRRPPEGAVSVAPSDFLYVVAHPREPERSSFNLGCLVVNHGPHDAQLRHLEASVQPAGQRALLYHWRGFYSLLGRGLMAGLDLRPPLALRAGESQLIGICFDGAPLLPTMSWPVGPFTVELAGWVDGEARRDPPDLHARFSAELTPEAWQQLAPWFSGKAAAQLVVPAAVPLAVRPGA
jgi:TIR domain